MDPRQALDQGLERKILHVFLKNRGKLILKNVEFLSFLVLLHILSNNSQAKAWRLQGSVTSLVASKNKKY